VRQAHVATFLSRKVSGSQLADFLVLPYIELRGREGGGGGTMAFLSFFGILKLE